MSMCQNFQGHFLEYCQQKPVCKLAVIFLISTAYLIQLKDEKGYFTHILYNIIRPLNDILKMMLTVSKFVCMTWEYVRATTYKKWAKPLHLVKKVVWSRVGIYYF